MKKDLCLIIPVYNGGSYIQDTLAELKDFFSHRNIVYDIVFVNDGSTDDTEKKLKQLLQKSDIPIQMMSYNKNRGKGYAIRYALKKIFHQYTYVGFTDVELPYGLEPFVSAMKHMDDYDDVDMVVGDRSLMHRDIVQYHWYRSIAHNIFRLFIPQIVRQFHDTQCGYKVFRNSIVRHMFDTIKTFRWVFDIELFVIAVIQDIKIYEMPVSIKSHCITKKGGVSFVRHGIYILRDLFRIHRAIRKKQYE